MSRNHATGASERGRPQTSLLARLVVVLVTTLVATSAIAATVAVGAPVTGDDPATANAVDPGTGPATAMTTVDASGDRSTDSAETLADAGAGGDPVDVVFVFDRSKSMNTERYQLASEMETFQRSLVDRGVDARFGLVSYTDDATVRQEFTRNFQEVEDALQFQTRGDVEKASDAVLTASEMDFREDAQRVVVFITDEDDDSSAESRQRALERLGDVTFVSLSPAAASTSGCDKHSPPCDNSTRNELRSYATKVGGTWVPIGTDAEESMQRVAAAVVDLDGDDGDDGGLSRRVDAGPDLGVTDRSVNDTSVEVGVPVAINATVANDGLTDGSTELSVTTGGREIATKRVAVDYRSERSATLVHRFDEPGEYKLVLNNERVAAVTVREPDETTVDLRTTAARNRLDVSVEDAWTTETVTVSVPDGSLLSTTGTELAAIQVQPAAGSATPRHESSFDLTVERITSPPADTPELSTDARAVTYTEVTSTLSDAELSSLAFQFARTDADVTMYRYDEDGDEWVALSHRTANDSEGYVLAETPELSTFALAADGPVVSVENATVGSTDVAAGDLVTGTVTVKNYGSDTETYDVPLSLDGEVVHTEQVDVQPRETKSVSITYAVEEPGEYALSVGGVDQGTLDVSEDSTSGDDGDDVETTADDGDEDATTAPDGPTPGFTPAVAVLAIVLLAGLGLRRR
jgi:hypothetical protein